jgi:hypothetical protein
LIRKENNEYRTLIKPQKGIKNANKNFTPIVQSSTFVPPQADHSIGGGCDESYIS